MTAQAIKSPEVTQAALSREDATFVAKNAGLVDHDQLMRLISVDAQIERCGTTTGISDDQFLAHIFE